MRIQKLSTGLMFFLMVFVSLATALDIPLSGGTEASGGMKIGYVDMDKIFQIYPQTQAAKEDYAKQLKKKREQLASKESELKDIEGKINVLESTMKQGGLTPPPGAVQSDPALANDPTQNANQSIDKMKSDLENRRNELIEMKKQATADLAAFQNQQSQLILGKIYQALRDVALEEQVAVVVDKSSILYGDASIDLTDRLQQRVRGF